MDNQYYLDNCEAKHFAALCVEEIIVAVTGKSIFPIYQRTLYL